MDHEHEIVAEVYAARDDNEAADRLLSRYMPFIKSETAKFIGRVPLEGHDDELSIAMFAFHEAVLAYRRGKGAFFPFASRAIRNRLIDYARRERRHAGHISLDMSAGDGEDERTVHDTLDTGENNVAAHESNAHARAEIAEFTAALGEYGLTLPDVADNCPKQARTLEACHRALGYAAQNPGLLLDMTATKRLPLAQLVLGSGAERKTLERHRKYMVAILLAYTNGFDIIRNHLERMAYAKGGRQR